MLIQASELGVRLEIVNGLPIWEAQPVYRHQRHVERIARGIVKPGTGRPGCDCVRALDVYIEFPTRTEAAGYLDLLPGTQRGRAGRGLEDDPGGRHRGGQQGLRGQGPGDWPTLLPVARG